MDLPSLTISNSVCRKLVNSTSAPDAIGPYNQANTETEEVSGLIPFTCRL